MKKHTIQAIYRGARLLGFAVRNPAGEIVAKFRRELPAARDAVQRDAAAATCKCDAESYCWDCLQGFAAAAGDFA